MGIEAVLVVLVACMCGMASLSSRGRAWVRACICGCRRQGNKYSDAFRSRCGTTSMVLAGGGALGRHTTYSYVHARAATSLNEHLGGPLRIKCWVVTHRAAFMGTAAGLGVIGASSGVVWMVYR